MPSSITTMARLGVFEGDVFERTEISRDLKNPIRLRAFAFEVTDDRVVLYEMPEDHRTRSRQWTVSMADLRTDWTMAERNYAMRRKVVAGGR